MSSARPAVPEARNGRRKRRRPVWAVLKLLLAPAVVVGGGAALYPVLHHAHQDPPTLTVRYKAGSSATAAVARPWLEVVNTSSRRVSLADVTLRYYYSADGAPSYQATCFQAAMGCSDVVEHTVALAHPSRTADHYLDVGFTTGAGTLAPGAKSGAIGLQLYRTDGKPADQRDDRSFDAAHTTFLDSTLVTGYLRGSRVWGDEPAGQPSASPRSGTAAPRQAAAPAPPPRDIVFDDFHYSGADDPALHAHGWLVRTSKGGPGILDTWTASGVTFPADTSAQGGQALQLRATTDGTRQGTTQSELQSSGTPFLTGTYAARIHFDDKPSGGRNGDHINESFYMISPNDSRYSELDSEYEPNGGWGSPGPRLDTTSWHSAAEGDRVTRQTFASLQGWHTVVITASHGVATYSVDGKKMFSSSGKYFPREDMSVNFNTWFVDLPFTGRRTWDMRVNWFYYNADAAQSLGDVQKAVTRLYGAGTHYVNTVPSS